MPYPEVAPQLVLMAFLQRVVNGGGFIDREYGVGRGRIDLLVRFPYRKPDGSRAVQRRALELKVWRKGQKDPLREGLAQIDDYSRACGKGAGSS
ncbi:PD-(D/E)XK nuclease domain-containing protein [Sorangium cellulosum]|nr:PD-(D/E)XK nuclease domain-containing protein [Sorangium cellulosum]